jgi:hypothetical protein
MPIYDKSTADLIRQFVAERPDQKVFTTAETCTWFQEHWPKVKRSTVGAHLIKMCTNAIGRVNWSVGPKDDLFFRIRPGQFRRYDPATDPKPFYERGLEESGPSGADSDEGEDAEGREEANAMFTYEDHLRDYLAPNLHILEPGLRLYEEGEINGKEYPIRNRRIDLLGVGHDGALVVIELKVSRGHEKAVGQILTYMGWVRKDLADGKPVRGIIVAHNLQTNSSQRSKKWARRSHSSSTRLVSKSTLSQCLERAT